MRSTSFYLTEGCLFNLRLWDLGVALSVMNISRSAQKAWIRV